MARTRERFADARAGRYAKQPWHLSPDGVKPGTRTLIACQCNRGVGVIVGTTAGRTLLECNFCGRRFYVLPAGPEWRP